MKGRHTWIQWYVSHLWGITQACKTIHGTCIPVPPTPPDMLTQSNVFIVLHWLVTTCVLPQSQHTSLSTATGSLMCLHTIFIAHICTLIAHICTLIAQLTTAMCGHIKLLLTGIVLTSQVARNCLVSGNIHFLTSTASLPAPPPPPLTFSSHSSTTAFNVSHCVTTETASGSWGRGLAPGRGLGTDNSYQEPGTNQHHSISRAVCL